MNHILISDQANDILKEYLNKDNNLIEIKKTDTVYNAVSSHVDIYLCKVLGNLIVAKEQMEYIDEALKKGEIKYELGNAELKSEYPNNICYNGVQLGNNFIHNIKYTDDKIMKIVKENSLNIINVKQGYSKCSITVVDDNSVITSDKGIAKELVKHKIDVLLIKAGSVKLEDFEYGFIGGASGRVGKVIVFNGNLEEHPDYIEIINFIEKKNLKVKYFNQYPLTDIGSILEIGDNL